MRKLMILLALVVLIVGLGPFYAAPQFGWGPGDEVRAKPGKPVELADGRFLNVRDLGTGPPIILIHGWASNAADWDRIS